MEERCTERDPKGEWICTQFPSMHDPDEHWCRITATSQPVGWIEHARWPVKK